MNREDRPRSVGLSADCVSQRLEQHANSIIELVEELQENCPAHILLSGLARDLEAAAKRVRTDSTYFPRLR